MTGADWLGWPPHSEYHQDGLWRALRRMMLTTNHHEGGGPAVVPDRGANDGDPYEDEGARRRDVGHASALSHGFVTSIRLAILHVARTRASGFTSEDVVDTLTPATIDALRAFPNALGACIRAEAKAGAIVPTGAYQAAQRPEARKRRLAVWRAGISGG